MKYAVLLLLLLLGLAVNVSAANVNAELFGTWISYDGPCAPCELNIQSGGVTFSQVGDAVDVTSYAGTAEPGIHVFLEGSGELDLALTKNSKHLVGYFKHYVVAGAEAVVSFDHKK